MTVFIVKKITGRTRKLLAAYNCEVSSGIYVGDHDEGTFLRIIKWLRNHTKDSEQILILRDKKSESWGFVDEYLHWENQALTLDGIRWYRPLR